MFDHLLYGAAQPVVTIHADGSVVFYWETIEGMAAQWVPGCTDTTIAWCKVLVALSNQFLASQANAPGLPTRPSLSGH